MKYSKGQEVKVKDNTPTYPTYDSRIKSIAISGNQFIYDEKIRNDRIRVTSDRSRVDIPMAMTGWIDIKNIEIVDGE